MGNVYLTRTASFLPNDPIENDQMESILGMVGGNPSRAKSIILRQNGIKKRYYARNNQGKKTHSNAELAASAIKKIFDNSFQIRDVELLCCGTSLPDQLTPSHASMVHGLLDDHPMEILSAAGVCCASGHALKYGYLSVLAGNTKNAICSASELYSPVLTSESFTEEFKELSIIQDNPMIAFEKDFLRWMLSDGAGAVLLEDKPCRGLSFKIDWIESISYANELPPCFYSGADFDNEGNFYGWKDIEPVDWVKKSLFTIKQNTRLLGENIIERGVEHIKNSLNKHQVLPEDIDYFLPHISSMFFKDKLKYGLIEKGVGIPDEKWFLNLPYVGNTGSASAYLMLDELFNSGKLKNNDKVFIIIPESGRFSYVTVLLTVVEN